MKRIIIIDGYNIIGKMTDFRSLEPGKMEFYRERLINLLAARFAGKKVRVILVFDGDRAGLMPVMNRKSGNIEIRFSGSQRSADRYIEILLEKYGKKDTEVISSDKRLKFFAQDVHSLHSGAGEFLNRIAGKEDSKSPDSGAEKPSDGEDEEFFRRAFGID